MFIVTVNTLHFSDIGIGICKEIVRKFSFCQTQVKNNKKEPDAHTSTCKYKRVQVGGNNIRWYQLRNSEMHEGGYLIWVQLNKKSTPKTLHSYTCKSKVLRYEYTNIHLSLIHTHDTSTEYNDIIKAAIVKGFDCRYWLLSLVKIGATWTPLFGQKPQQRNYETK